MAPDKGLIFLVSRPKLLKQRKEVLWMNWLGLCVQNPTWLLKVGSPNLTKGRIFARREAAGGVACLPNLRASRWSEDVKTESWGLLILTTAREGGGGGRAFDSQQTVLLRIRVGCQTPCSSPRCIHTRHLWSVHPYRPRNVWFITVSNTFQENAATNLWTRVIPHSDAHALKIK